MKVPFIDLNRQHSKLENELKAIFSKVMSKGIFVFGDELTSFEKEMAEYTTAKYAFGVANGTSALVLSLNAAGAKTGDEIITTPFTFVATAEAAALLGAKPVFCDIDPETFNINPDNVPALITDKTKVILPVHIFGQPADMNKIEDIARKNDLIIIEDAAQALGAKYKNRNVCTLGDMAGVSFYPTKNLSALGDAGIIITNNKEYADKIKGLRAHGSTTKYYHEYLGYNDRLDELQAAFLRIKLKYLDKWNARRRGIAKKYDEALRNHVKVPYISPWNETTYHQYTVRIGNRNELQKYLAEKGIATAIHYPIPLHLQPAFSYLNYKIGDFPIAEKACNEVLSLPIFQELTDEQIDYVIDSIKSFYV